MSTLKFKKIDDRAIIPQYKTKGAAAFDFHGIISEKDCMGEETDKIVLSSGKQVVIRTGLSVSIPEGWEIQIRPRSGNAFKNGITVTNSPGTIDSDYRGEIKIILLNTGENPFPIKHGDRIAQGKFSEAIQAEIIEVDELDSTERGQGGFGSTGTS